MPPSSRRPFRSALPLLSLLASASPRAAASRAVPTPVQLAWQGRFGAIFHYNMATDALQTGHGCGRGNWALAADPRTFGRALAGGACPDTDAWLDAVVAGGMDYAVLVAKHNCGFATWPTAATLPGGAPYAYSIAHSSAPPGCDVVARFLASCAARGVQPGLYYSFGTNLFLNVQGGLVSNATLMPGQALVTQREFFDIVLFQVEEIWRRAPLLEIWADGGIPEDPHLRAGLTALRAKYQPAAVFYNGFPTFNDTAVRWIGNEDGAAPDPTWSSGSCNMGNGGHGPLPEGGDPDDPSWCPAEVDSTLQANDSWFFQSPDLNPLNSLAALVASYHASLGRNANWLLGLSPAPNGTLAPQHAALAAQLGAWLSACYGAPPLASGAMAPGATQLTVVVPGGGHVRGANRARLREDQTDGQLVRSYNLSAALVGGGGVLVASGTSVGSGKIDLVHLAVDATGFTLVTDAAPRGLTLEVFRCEDPQ